MITLYDTVEWQETPRMRWRVIGVRQYLLDNLTAVCVISVFFGTVVAAYGLLLKPSWWHDARWGTVLLGAGFGAFSVLLYAAFGATVRLSRTDLEYKSIRGGLYSWSDFNRIQCVQWHGLLRITLETSAGAVLVIAAPVKRAADIEFFLKATGKLVPQEPVPSR